MDKRKIIENYLNQLNDCEKKAYNIAKEKLGSSFDIEKSIGFINYLKTIKDS